MLYNGTGGGIAGPVCNPDEEEHQAIVSLLKILPNLCFA